MGLMAMNDKRKMGMAARFKVSLVVLAALGLATPPVRAADDEGPSGDFLDRVGESVGGSLGGVKQFFGYGKAPPPPTSEAPSGCPAIDVLDGTGAQRIMANAAAGNAGLRHQFSISDVARECKLSNNQMVLKVGVEGKVLLGPAGAPGKFDVPIRVAIIDRIDQKPLVSKLYKVAASIAAGEASTGYTLVADTLVVPLPAGRTAGDYSVKIGIDTGRSEGAPAPNRKRKPIAAAQ